jgi:cytochrome c oxidase assembly protein subunit 15
MWLNRYAGFLAFATFLLIIAGGLVTSNDYGLAVPDWPKSYGMWMPPMIGGVIYEHGHRMIAATVGFLTIILTVWLLWKERRKWVRVLGVIALLAVIAQGVLGGLTVLYLLPRPISVLHATLAQSFFSLIVSIVLFTSREWQQPPQHAGNSRRVAPLILATSVAIYLQLILGAWMRHAKAALAIPDFPLALGRVIPPFDSPEVVIHFAHRVGALIVFVLISMNLFVIRKHVRDVTKLTRPAAFLFILVLVQLALGAFTVWTKTAVWAATSHVAVGALLLATSVVLALRGFRMLKSEIPSEDRSFATVSRPGLGTTI